MPKGNKHKVAHTPTVEAANEAALHSALEDFLKRASTTFTPTNYSGPDALDQFARETRALGRQFEGLQHRLFLWISENWFRQFVANK